MNRDVQNKCTCWTGTQRKEDTNKPKPCIVGHITHTHTHTHIHTHTHFYTRPNTHAHTMSHTCTLSLSHTHNNRILSLSLAQTLFYTHTNARTHADYSIHLRILFAATRRHQYQQATMTPLHRSTHTRTQSHTDASSSNDHMRILYAVTHTLISINAICNQNQIHSSTHKLSTEYTHTHTHTHTHTRARAHARCGSQWRTDATLMQICIAAHQ
jgi:hypothetical protein